MSKGRKKRSFMAAALGLLLLCAAPAFAMDLDMISDENEREDGVSYVNAVSFGWGGGGVSRPSTHAPSETDSLLPYGALELVAGSENGSPTLGGQPLDICLQDGNSITASLAFFDGEAILQSEPANVLCLFLEGVGGCWQFSGKTLRKLETSGLAWVAFQTQQNTVVVPVSGFVAGREYDAWRKKGITDGMLQYSLTITENREPQLSVRAEEQWLEAADAESGLYYIGIISIGRGEP